VCEKNSSVSVKYEKRCTQEKIGSFFLPHSVVQFLCAVNGPLAVSL